MKVEVWLDSSSTPAIYEARAVYTKGGLLCIYTTEGRAIKYPLCRVHKVVHDYNTFPEKSHK